MLRILQAGLNLPASFILDPSAEFQPGMIAELTVVANQVMATVSNGTAPIGIIDDIRTRAFTSVSYNETVEVPAIGVPGLGGQLVTPVDIKAELRKPNIISSSFYSSVKLALNPLNGVVIFLAGTPLNFDMTGSGRPNAIKAIVNYTYYVANIPGDDSTAGSNRVTVWFNRMFFSTDQFESNQPYPLKANLFVSERGLLTTRKQSNFHPCVALVTAPPTPSNPFIEAMWL